MLSQDALARPRQAILGQQADDFKQGGADGIIKIFGRQFLLPRIFKARANIFPKLADEVGSGMGNSGLWNGDPPEADGKR